jgi:hypothetical protein
MALCTREPRHQIELAGCSDRPKLDPDRETGRRVKPKEGALHRAVGSTDLGVEQRKAGAAKARFAPVWVAQLDAKAAISSVRRDGGRLIAIDGHHPSHVKLALEDAD